MTRRRLAVVAFALHAPGLWLVARYRLRREVLIVNGVALAGTLIAMALALPAGWGGVVIAWLCGHFAWSAVLAALVATGRAGAVAQEAT